MCALAPAPAPSTSLTTSAPLETLKRLGVKSNLFYMYKFKYCRYRSNNCTSIFSLSNSIIDATSRLSRHRDPVGNMLLICRSFVPRSTCLNRDTNCYSGRGGLQQGSVPDSGRPCWSRGRGVPARHSNAKGMFAVSCFMSNNFSHERLLSIELIVLSD